ncbi:hypothetical protein EYF80_025567 [Liparis tanakae]|uniref:Uncharacterized protein n=1 Tax=Liparis tanakae TaxID=230148 RepID=A0A4Z2HED8_9TELE|nr:hypothetical protein EYF80_025567 [Liparis tanakae]
MKCPEKTLEQGMNMHFEAVSGVNVPESMWSFSPAVSALFISLCRWIPLFPTPVSEAESG